jgi:hypothetical protein
LRSVRQISEGPFRIQSPSFCCRWLHRAGTGTTSPHRQWLLMSLRLPRRLSSQARQRSFLRLRLLRDLIACIREVAIAVSGHEARSSQRRGQTSCSVSEKKQKNRRPHRAAYPAARGASNVQAEWGGTSDGEDDDGSDGSLTRPAILMVLKMLMLMTRGGGSRGGAEGVGSELGPGTDVRIRIVASPGAWIRTLVSLPVFSCLAGDPSPPPTAPDRRFPEAAVQTLRRPESSAPNFARPGSSDSSFVGVQTLGILQHRSLAERNI